jgi:peptide/nickel transport system permease protein
MTLAGVILQRVAALAAVLLVVSLVTFVITYVIPGDAAQMISGPRASAAQVELVRHRLGLDRPLPVQYGEYLHRLVVGDLGNSMASGRPVLTELTSRLPATFELMASALVVSVSCGVALGVLAALRRGTVWDQLIRFVSLCGNSWPTFCSGLILLLVFYARLGWLPPGGRLDPGLTPPAHVTGFLQANRLLPAMLCDTWSCRS